jgi:acetyl-CoA acyltransferase
MRGAVIVDAVRTASGKGKPGGALSGTHPVELLAAVLTALVERTGLDPARIDDVITGCVAQVGEQSLNIGRASRRRTSPPRASSRAATTSRWPAESSR